MGGVEGFIRDTAHLNMCHDVLGCYMMRWYMTARAGWHSSLCDAVCR